MPIHPTPVFSRIVGDGEAVSIVRKDLPAMASEAAYAITLTEGDLVSLLADLRSSQLGLDADRTGGL